MTTPQDVQNEEYQAKRELEAGRELYAALENFKGKPATVASILIRVLWTEDLASIRDELNTYIRS